MKRRTAPTTKPGGYAALIKQCAYPECPTYFIGTPASRYCEHHKRVRAAQLKADWQRTHRKGEQAGRRSRFSREEIIEMREMFYLMPVTQIAEHFGCNRALIYRYIRKDPQNYRDV